MKVRELAFLFLGITLFFTGCVTTGGTSSTIADEYQGIYLADIVEDPESEDFGSIMLVVIKQDEEKKNNFTSQVLFSSSYLEKVPLEIDAYHYDGGYIKAKGNLDPSETKQESFYFQTETFPEGLELPAEDFIDYYRTTDGKIQVIEYGMNDRFYKTTGISTFEDVQKIENEYREYYRNLEENRNQENERKIKESKQYFINLFAGKKVYFLPQNNYVFGWKKPEPFIAELLADGESIRFVSDSNNLYAKDKVFLLTWNKSLEAELASFATAPLSDNTDILFPSFIMDSEKEQSMVIYNEVTPNFMNILNTYGMSSEKTIFLTDITKIDQGNMFMNMMTNQAQDTEASFYLIIEE